VGNEDWGAALGKAGGADSPREGMVEGLSLGSDLPLVDYTARLYRAGKAAVSREVAAILDRLAGIVLNRAIHSALLCFRVSR
jgi:hypothetical protein